MFMDSFSVRTAAINRCATKPRPCPSKHPRLFNCRDVLLVEHRDEVAARLVADLNGVESGNLRIGASEASRIYVRFAAELLVVNVDLPDASGWLLTAKLSMFSPVARIWLYTHRLRSNGASFMRFVGAEELIDYCGDLWRLSDEIVSACPP